MKRVLVVCIAVLTAVFGSALAAQASTYIGDYCWFTETGDYIVLTVSSVGIDTEGYENYIYNGKVVNRNSPITGNCTQFRNGSDWRYRCTMVNAGGSANAVMLVDLDYDTLDGYMAGITHTYDSSSGQILAEFVSVGMTWYGQDLDCPVW